MNKEKRKAALILIENIITDYDLDFISCEVDNQIIQVASDLHKIINKVDKKLGYSNLLSIIEDDKEKDTNEVVCHKCTEYIDCNLSNGSQLNKYYTLCNKCFEKEKIVIKKYDSINYSYDLEWREKEKIINEISDLGYDYWNINY